jgi:predicted RND superfamily exporter protein
MMKRWQTQTEEMFRSLGVLFFHHRIKTLTLCLIVFSSLLSFLPDLKFDTSTESFFHEDDPAIIDYTQFRNRFGRDDLIIIAVKPDNLFKAATLSKLKTLHEAIETNLPHIDDLTSLINARIVRGTANQLIVKELVEQVPTTSAELDALQTLAMSNDFYRDFVLSSDGRIAAILIKLDTYAGTDDKDETILNGFEETTHMSIPVTADAAGTYLSDDEVSDFINRLENILKPYQTPDFVISVAGSPVVENAVKRLVQQDMTRFSAASLIIIAFLLYLMFHRLTGVLAPLIIVIMAMVSMLGTMALCKVPITIVTQILSSFILVVGVADSVHILAIYYMEFDQTGNREHAIGKAMAHSGLPIMLTSLTTAGGLISFAWADIAPVAHMGIFAAIGVVIAFLYTMVMLPALMAALPMKPSSKSSFIRSGNLLKMVAVASTRHPKRILVVAGVLTVLSIMGLGQLRFSHNILEWLPGNLPERQATLMLDKFMQGTVSLEAVIDTHRPNGLYDADFLNRLDAVEGKIKDIREEDVFVGKVMSLTTILKETHQALNENRPSHYVIPQNNQLIAQEFLLFENSGSDDLEDVMDITAQIARVTIKAPFKDAIQYSRFIDRIQNQFAEALPDVDITMTGIMALFLRTVINVMTSVAKSYVIAFSIICLMMFIFLRYPSVATISMVPNLVPIIMVLGFMGWSGIDLDSSNLLIGSIVIGLIVDDTIHFMHNFTRYYRRNSDTPLAIQKTLMTTGRALLVTSLVLFFGFLVYGLSSLSNIFNFGFLTALAILLALAADFFIVPALLTLRFTTGRPL